MAICKYCGESIPQLELFKHFNQEHPDEMRELRSKAGRSRKKKGGDIPEDPGGAAQERLKATVTMNPVQAAIMEFVGEKIQVPMTPALIYGYFCAKKMGFGGNIAEFIQDVIDDFFKSRGINYYAEVMEWEESGRRTSPEGETTESPTEKLLAIGTGAR